MHLNATTRLLTSAAAALALSAWACSNTSSDQNNTATPGAAGTSGAANEQSINLTGCLQETGGMTGDYILTQVNSQSRPIGTSGSAPNSTAPNSTAPGGSSASGDIAAREQQNAAAQSYRLDGDNSQLKDLVGKQVSVSGRVTDQAKISGASGTPANPATTANPNTTANPATGAGANHDISASDLARVKVDSITKVADSCGNTSGR